ncbi:MAG: DUF523 and DUF1722 domain-containing protein [Porticoccaceae bacterium]|nr:DUF523 and DUF1722 domain-containing protein [Porticoccaceae bacterium]
MAKPEEPQKIPVGVSSCLLGERVRYDGGHKYNPHITNTLRKYFNLIPFCPEVDIGLGVPREAVHLVMVNNAVRCVSTVSPKLDITEQLINCAEQQKHWHENLSGYIFKRNSSSCGPNKVNLVDGNGKVLDHHKTNASGVGLYAQELMKNFPYLPVEDEDSLSHRLIRENFIMRVGIYHCWQSLLTKELSLKALSAFHQDHQHIFIKHHKRFAVELETGLVSAEQDGDDIKQVKDVYIERLTRLLKIIPASKNL